MNKFDRFTLVAVLAVAVMTTMPACSQDTGAPGETAKSAAGTHADAGAADGKTVTTGSGLQYEVLESGEGATPLLGDRVTVHYRGTLTDGTEFDSSHKRGKPATFPVNGVIRGWTEALQLMSEGDKWKLTIPSELAYGSRGAPPRIPPDSTLVFEVELIKVN